MSGCEQGAINSTKIEGAQGDIRTLYRLIEERNSEVTEQSKAIVRLESKFDAMSKQLTEYMKDGLEFRQQVKENTAFRKVWAGLFAIITGGSVVGLITVFLTVVKILDKVNP